jgi:hypothetical protein
MGYDISVEESGARVAVGEGCHFAVLPDGETPPKLFRRRAIKRHSTGEVEEVCWLVGELNGVRVYKDGDHFVMTTADLNP